MIVLVIDGGHSSNDIADRGLTRLSRLCVVNDGRKVFPGTARVMSI